VRYIPGQSHPMIDNPNKRTYFQDLRTITEDKTMVLSRVWMECDYRRVLDSKPDSLDSLILRVTTLYSSLLHTHTHTHTDTDTSTHSHVFTAVAW
jgi:hypothetical protein